MRTNAKERQRLVDANVPFVRSIAAKIKEQLPREIEFDDLVASMRRRGFDPSHPIILCEELILDGRNRWRACQLAGVEPRTRQFPEGQDPLAFVLAANLHRRHLAESQRAMVAAKSRSKSLAR